LFFERNRFTLNWNEYQQGALTTAIYPLKRELEYTVLGLCSEVGEVGVAYAAGKDGWGYTQAQTETLLKEIGDVYWYVAAVADALNVPLQHIWDSYTVGVPALGSRGLTVLAIGGASADIAGILKKAIRDNDGFLADAGAEEIQKRLGAILIQLANLVHQFGSTPEAVTAKNLNKLADRKSRGVLQGSGDNR
jgi:NTP pyrophosphatase (non-canonical NTP hydrolase)